MRKVELKTIAAEGRDKGKVFVLREMSASQAEKWAIRAFLALAKSGVEIPDDVRDAGVAGLATIGIRALSGISYDDAVPLLDEMFSCISIMPDPTRPEIVRALIEDDIEEVATRFKLRQDLIELHVGFSMGAALSKLSPAAPTGGNI